MTSFFGFDKIKAYSKIIVLWFSSFIRSGLHFKTMKKYLLFGLVLTLLVSGCTIKKKSTITVDEAKTKVQDYINNNLMQPGNQVSIKEVVEEDALYKVTVNMPNGQEIISYMSKDGKKFFPQAMDTEEKADTATETDAKANANQAAEATAEVPKQEKAKVELFVMSHCPFGTQIEKGMVPVIEKLGNKVDFELKFCDYAMHGENELDEELVQYCVQKEEPAKLLPYLRCFLGSANNGSAVDREKCIKDSGISKSKIDSCVAKTDKEFNVKSDFNDKKNYKGQFPGFGVYGEDNKKYGVGGSPTLVINGTTVRSGRDSATLMKNICAGFQNPPAECNEQIDSASPSAGFGWNAASGSNSAASCGS